MVYFPEGYTPIVPTKSPVVNKIIIFLDYLPVYPYYKSSEYSIKAHTTKYLRIKMCIWLF